MRVQFTERTVWYDLTFAEGEITEVDQAIAQRLLRAGRCVPAPEMVQKTVTEAENGEDITTSEDGGIGEPLDDSVSEDAPKRRAVRRHK